MAQDVQHLCRRYDEWTKRIPGNRQVDERQANLQKLQAMIAEMQEENRLHGKTSAERKKQFDQIFEQGMQLEQRIRDEPIFEE